MMKRLALVAGALALTGCHETVQLLDPSGPIVGECEVCTDDVGCQPAPNGTACSRGTCDIGECADAPLQAFEYVAAGHQHSCSIRSSGELYCWGRNEAGQLGTGDTENRPRPTRVDDGPWRTIALGKSHSCGIKANGTLWCWGKNSKGQLGTADSSDVAAPRQVLEPAFEWEQVAVGEEHSCALSASAMLLCWGRGEEGQIGLGDSTSQSIPMPVLPEIDDFRLISLGKHHSCAVETSGKLHCWGQNAEGQLGTGELTASLSPARVDLDATVTAVAAGGDHTCALASSGQSYCFGRNKDGELGLDDKDLERVTVPATLGAYPELDQLGLGDRHSCGLADGSLWCWGRGDRGQLGHGDKNERLAPRRVDAADGWEQVVGGERHTCALRPTGQVYCWGSGESGQLGVGDLDERLLPTQIVIDD